jgi:DNA polymerase-3 subunit beta
MKVTCSPQQLGQGLQAVSRAVSTRTTLPILNNVLIQTTPAGLQLTATNLEIGIKHTVAAEVQEEGGISAPARLLTDFVTSLPEEKLSITLDKKSQSLNLKCSRFDANIRGIDAAEYPAVPTTSAEGRVLQFNQSEFQTAIDQTTIAASADEGRPVLTGVYAQLNGQSLVLAATDGHRLAVKTMRTENGKGEATEQVVIPARALAELSRILKDGKTDVALTLPPAKNQVFFKAGGVELMSRLIEGTYPNYQQVIPAEAKTKVRTKTQELLRTAKVVSYFAKDSANVIKLSAAPGKLILAATTSEIGGNTAEVEAEVEGQEVQIAFNAKYLLDVLQVLGSEDVSLTFNGPLSPGVIKPVGREDYVYIIMPVRVAM